MRDDRKLSICLPFTEESAVARLSELRRLCASDGAVHNELCSCGDCPERRLRADLFLIVNELCVGFGCPPFEADSAFVDVCSEPEIGTISGSA